MQKKEFAPSPLPHVLSIFGVVLLVNTAAVEEVIQRTKPEKITGPDDITAELWKVNRWDRNSGSVSSFKRREYHLINRNA